MIYRNLKGSPLTHSELDSNFRELFNDKQVKLVSAKNIKTIDGKDLLGLGNIQLNIPKYINNLNDVTLLQPKIGQALVYNGTSWVNTNISDASQLVTIPRTRILDGKVLLTKPALGDVVNNIGLVYDTASANDTVIMGETTCVVSEDGTEVQVDSSLSGKYCTFTYLTSKYFPDIVR